MGNSLDLTSFNRPGRLGRHINAIPSQITAVSSTKTPSGKLSSACNSITSRPSFLEKQIRSSFSIRNDFYLRTAI